MGSTDWVALLILVCGGILFAVVAIFAVRAVARLALSAPELHARVAELEAKLPALEAACKSAVDAAEKARRLATKPRSARRAQPQEEDEPQPAPVADEPRAPNDPFDWARGIAGANGPAETRGPSKGPPLSIEKVERA